MSNQQVQVSRQEQLRPFLLASQRQISSLLNGDTDKAKRFMAASLVVASDSSLNGCSPDSIIQALIGVAMLDVSIDKNLGHAYLIPYKGSGVQLQIGYKGYIQLLFRAGWLVKAFPVFNCDDFTISFDGWDNKVNFVPALDDRDEGDKKWCYENLRGVYVVSRHADTKDEFSMFVNKSVIEKSRMASQNQNNAKQPDHIWKDWYVEMAMGKAIKKLSKTLPIGDHRAQMAIVVDDKADAGNPIDFKRSAEESTIIESTSVEINDPAKAPKKDDPYALGTTLSLIENTSSLDELSAIDMTALNAKDQKVARTAWLKKKDELQPKAQVQALSIPNRINACTSAQDLNNLIVEINDESVELEHDTLIGEKYDSFR
jgi:recombination protein RecT